MPSHSYNKHHFSIVRGARLIFVEIADKLSPVDSFCKAIPTSHFRRFCEDLHFVNT